jgi:ferredoxin-thioredoxin reductase catalytic subunit
MHEGELAEGMSVTCTVCGARLEVVSIQPVVMARRYAQVPELEIRERAENFARLRGYRFDEMKEPILEGLLTKYRRFGDFYCPCRFDNIPEHICPCLETRLGEVRKAGRCLCGLFLRVDEPTRSQEG